MKKNFRKPLKSLMLTAMALLTATATAVNATSYSKIIVEHIWEDNNNAYNTRPDSVTVDITQVQGKDNTPTGNQASVSEVTDNGSAAGKEAGKEAAEKGGKEELLKDAEEKGKTNGIQAGAAAKDLLEALGTQSPDDIMNSDKPKPVKPEDLPKPEDLKDYTGEDGKKYQFDEAIKEAYQAKLDEYQKAYEAYQSGKQEALEEYKEAYKDLLNYLEVYAKAEYSGSRPGGNDAGFQQGFLDGFGNGLTAEDLNKAYQDAFNAGYTEGYNGTSKAPQIEGDDRDQLIGEITDKIENFTPGQDKEVAEQIIDQVNGLITDLVEGTETENLWSTTTNLVDGEEKDENGNPLNYQAGMEAPEAKKDFLKDTLGLSEDDLESIGYTTKQLKIEITLVKGEGETEPRVYVSIDGGKNWAGVGTDQDYDPDKDVVDVTKFTFLHTLNVPLAPPEVDYDWDDDIKEPEPNPKTTIDDEEVPQTNIEDPEVPEEEIPEEDVPLTDVPKTGDTSLLWMCAALFSGTALLALLKKEKEAQEA